MPPVFLLPYTAPVAVQLLTLPSIWFRPTMAPVFTRPLTVPVKLHERMVPSLTPAMPPAASLLPCISTVPDTFRFLTTPLSCTEANSPALE